MTKQEEISQFHCKICGKTQRTEQATGVIIYSDGICSDCLKREEIKEGIEQILAVLYNFHLDGDAYADEILSYLHSQGVVIKVKVTTKEKIPKLAFIEPLIAGVDTRIGGDKT